MQNIINKQRFLLRLTAQKHSNPMDNPSEQQFLTNGDIIDYILHQKFFLDEEITELFIATGRGDKAIFKSWSSRHKELTEAQFESNEDIKSEAIDMLCFCLNICLAVGISPQNINDEYEKVWMKNIKRQEGIY